MSSERSLGDAHIIPFCLEDATPIFGAWQSQRFRLHKGKVAPDKLPPMLDCFIAAFRSE